VSRSDNTAWQWDLGGLEKNWATWSLPRGTGRDLRRRWQKMQRQRERVALRLGAEPEPTRSRHSVQRDYW
jgi:hypothetical protein